MMSTAPAVFNSRILAPDSPTPSLAKCACHGCGSGVRCGAAPSGATRESP